MGFCKFTIHFPNETVSRNMHGLIFDADHFLTKYRPVGYLIEEAGESLHFSINKQL